MKHQINQAKLEALSVAEAQLATAEKKLSEAMVRDACNARLAELTATFKANG